MFLYFTLNAAKSYNTATGTQKEKHQEYLFNKSKSLWSADKLKSFQHLLY